MTRKELLDLAREKFVAAGDRPQAWLGIAACAIERAFFEINRIAIGLFEDGLQHCDRALALDPEWEEAKVWKALLLLRKAERLSGKDASDGIEAAARALDGVPDSPFALNARGAIALISADRRIEGAAYQAALKAFDDAVAARSDYVPALLNSARVRIRLARELSSSRAVPLSKTPSHFAIASSASAPNPMKPSPFAPKPASYAPRIRASPLTSGAISPLPMRRARSQSATTGFRRWCSAPPPSEERPATHFRRIPARFSTPRSPIATPRSPSAPTSRPRS